MLDWSTMRTWSADLLRGAGLETTDALAVAETLYYAERRGFASHGFMRLITYCERIQAGGINRHPAIKIVGDLPALAIVDADHAAGAASAIQCVDLALAKAQETGIGFVFAREANHFGAAGFYTDRIAAAGFVGVATCNTDAVMCAPFGGRPVLGTNPLSIAVPGADGIGAQLDMATSEASYGKVIYARDHDERIPQGWAVDSLGRATQDPAEALAGALLPAGGPKGFGLAFMLDCLVAVGGATTSNVVGALYGDPATPQRLGHAFVAIRIDAERDRSKYVGDVASLVDAVHGSQTSHAKAPPMVPGEPEQIRLQSAAWESDPVILANLVSLSATLGVTLPKGIADSGFPRQ